MRENDRNIIRGLAEQYREHCESERNYFDRASEQQIVREYRTLVQDQILKYWKQVAPDRQYGGFITDFDRRWNVRSTDKGAWGQGRLIYSFSETHEHFPEEGWLDLARLGKDFALQHMYAGNGRFYYLVDRTGAKVLDGPTSVFSDGFIIAGLARFRSASGGGTPEDAQLLQSLFDRYAENIMDVNFSDTAPFEASREICSHALPMIGLNVAYEVNRVLPSGNARQLIDHCLDAVLNGMYDPETGLILEKKYRDGRRCQGPNALLVNTGHAFESMWFCLEAILTTYGPEDPRISRIRDIAETNYRASRGPDGESVFSYSAGEDAIKFKTWKYEIDFAGTDKVSWSYAEEMYLWALLAKLTGEETYFRRFLHLHQFTQTHFIDREYGDWFHALNQNNEVIYDFKGSTVKVAFHMLRAMLRIMELFSTEREN